MRGISWLVGGSAAVVLVFAGLSVLMVRGEARRPDSSGLERQALQAFASVEPVDTHTHIYKDDPVYQAMLRRLHLHIVDIVDVSDNGDPERKSLDREESDVFRVAKDSDGHASVCTTFDPYRMNDPGFAQAAIARLNESFRRGAIAVKLWKNVGMEIRDRQGHSVLPDERELEPIYRDIAAHHKTLVTHVADPDTAWEALDGSQPDGGYYRAHPEWHLYGRAGAPAKAEILRARDHVLERNPELRMVGAHLGSMEAHLDELAQHLDRYPNFAVDVAGRIPYFKRLPRATVIAFVTKYRDRLIYGTDDTIYPQDNVNRAVAEMESGYARDWEYFATRERVKAGTGMVEGLGLPPAILRRIYHDNAVRWFPGIESGKSGARP